MRYLTETDIKKLINRKIPERFRGGYYGTRNANFFTDEFKQYVAECESFTDITAGTGQFPYHLAQNGTKQVGVNDLSFYAYLILSTIFDHDSQLLDSNRFEQIIQNYATILEPPLSYDGFLSNNIPIQCGEEIFNKELTGYIDYICKTYNDDNVILYAVGKTIIGNFTFRARGFTRKQTNGNYCYSCSPLEFYNKLIRNIVTILKYKRQSTSNTSNTMATNLDALDSIEKHNVSNGFVYMDPAWPWTKKKQNGKNPYTFFSITISEILLQRKIEVKRYWEKQTPECEIIGEVSKWISKSFECGAKYFCVCTQDTNYPEPHYVFGELKKQFNLIDVIEIQDWSSSANHHYINYWAIFENISSNQL